MILQVTLLSVFLFTQVCGNDTKAIVVISNWAYAVWTQLMLREFVVLNVDVVCITEGEIRKIDNDAFDNLCTHRVQVHPSQAPDFFWQKLRIFDVESLRQYDALFFIDNNVKLRVSTLLDETYSQIQNTNASISMISKKCNNLKHGRLGECLSSDVFCVHTRHLLPVIDMKIKIKQLVKNIGLSESGRGETRFLTMLFGQQIDFLPQNNLDIRRRYVQGCHLDDNKQCMWTSF